jgi:hypothetical protein
VLTGASLGLLIAIDRRQAQRMPTEAHETEPAPDPVASTSQTGDRQPKRRGRLGPHPAEVIA